VEGLLVPQVIPAIAAAGSAIFAAGAPISLAAGTIGFGVAGGTAAVLGGVALNIALLAGSTALQYALQPRAGIPSPDAQQALKQAVKNTVEPQRLVLGEVQTSGVLFFEETKPPHYYGGYILASHECDGLDSVYVNNTRVFLDGLNAASVPFFDGSTVFLSVSFRDGDANQARDTIITNNSGDFDLTYGTDYRQRGLSTAVIKARHAGANQSELWGTGSFLPQVNFRFRGAKVYDPRDPSQTLDDQSTWRYSNNAALCAGRYVTFSWAGRPRIIEPSRVNWARIAHAADICDRWRTMADGIRERDYTINGVIKSNEQPAQVLQGMMASMNAVPVVYQGKWFVQPFDRRQNPVGTLHDGLILGSLSLRAERPSHEIINTIRAKFVSDERDYTPQETPAYIDTVALASDGGITREASLSLPYTYGNERAQRLSRLAIRENRRGRALTCEVDIQCRSWRIGDVVCVDLETLPEMNGTYRITRRSWLRNGTAFALTLEEWATDIDDWRAADHAQPFTLEEDLVD
jgi:hypothetical protein